MILHLDMNAFFASVEQQANPRLRGQPVLVCGNRQSRTVVATASYEARAFGVKTGMSLQEARALCPTAAIVEGDPAKYADLFRQVARMMERYSPVLEVFSIDEAFLDLTHTADRFGGALAVAQALHDEVRARLGLPCSIGIGPNKLLAKLASSMKKPNGITQIDPADVTQVLATLPIEALCGIGRAFQEALNAQGITTCGQLARVPLERLMAQFGACAGRHLFRLARGIDDAPVIAAEDTPAAKSMGHLHTLAHDTSDPAVMRAVLLELSEKVGRRLRAEGAAGRTVTVTVRSNDFTPYHGGSPACEGVPRTSGVRGGEEGRGNPGGLSQKPRLLVPFDVPSNGMNRGTGFTTSSRARTFARFFDDGYDIYDAGCRILEGLRLPSAIRMLGICVSGLSYGPRQAWWVPEILRQRQLLLACDRINDRFGEATVRRAALLDEPEAQRHYQLKRYTARTL